MMGYEIYVGGVFWGGVRLLFQVYFEVFAVFWRGVGTPIWRRFVMLVYV